MSQHFHEFLGGMGNGGAAPMQVDLEIGEDDTQHSTSEFIKRGENF